MRIYKTSYLFLLLLFQCAFSQAISANKQGGICFRIDDDQEITNWQQYAAVFARYNYNFTFCLNIALVAHNADYISLIKDLQAAGNELADHTPNHITSYFTPSNPEVYKGLPGVDHIFGDTVALVCDSFDTTTIISGDGFANLVNNNMLISQQNGQFTNFSTSNIGAIYLPSLHKLVSFSGFSNINKNNPDTIYLRTFWNEAISLPTAQNIPIKMIGAYDIRMNINGLSLLAKCSLDYFSQLAISRPYTWIQPGGAFPQLSPQDAKIAFGIDNSYTSAGVYPNAALKCYNEYNPNGDRQYATMWGDFYEDVNSFAQVKGVIADRIAKHYFSIGHSHFSELLGGWDSYLARMDSLLSWCKAKNILVTTKAKMTSMLYDITQNPYTNIFPSLDVDLDGNGIPDGYTSDNGTLDTTSGVPESGNRSYSIQKAGAIFRITSLAGLEKGENDFYISTKGGSGDVVDVKFVFNDGKTIILSFPVQADWKRYSCANSINSIKELVVPDDASYCDIYLSCSTYKSDTVRVSGFELYKKVYQAVKIMSTPDTMARLNGQYKYKTAVAAQNAQDMLTYTLLTAPAWLSIDQNGLLMGNTPSQIGSYPVQIAVQDQHANADTQSYTLSVVQRKQLNVTPQNISLGTIPFGTKKDTVVILSNPGLDTITKSNIEQSGGVSVFSQTNQIMPQQSVIQELRITAESLGYLNASVKFISNAIDSMDTVQIALAGNIIVNIPGIPDIPKDFALYQNYPNPFNPSTTLLYALPSEGSAKIEVFDILGRRVCTLVPEQNKEMGLYSTIWSGKNDSGKPVASGVYFARFIAKSNSGTVIKTIVKKMLMIR